MTQLSLFGKKRGKKRGRPTGSFPLVRHRRRPEVDGRTPVHITWRMARSVPNLRSQRCMAVVRRVFAEGKERLGMRLVHFAVQPDHMHLVVEPEHERALSRALQGLSIRLAKNLNRELRRGGRVF